MTERQPLKPGTAVPEFLRLYAIDTDECTLWPYNRSGKGYGRLKILGQHQGTHRLSCIKAHGMPPFDGAQAAHSCGTPLCMNPRHLRWATNQENAADRANHGTQAYGRMPEVVLSDTLVREMRIYRRAGVSVPQLAAHYGITQTHASRVVNGKSWKHVQPI